MGKRAISIHCSPLCTSLVSSKINILKMDIANARILMRKINNLLSTLDQDNAQLSPIERDLMLSYLRQLYAVFLEGKNPEVTPEVRSVKAPPVAPVLPATNPAVGIKPEVPVDTISKGVNVPVVPPVTLPPAEPAPLAREKEVVVPANGLEKLFEFKKPTEISERLGETQIHDLNAAMSINERHLYIYELFGRDRSAMEDSLGILNRFDAFAAAKSFLMSLAEQYQWTLNQDRAEIAQNFIKLVRRRYPSL